MIENLNKIPNLEKVKLIAIDVDGTTLDDWGNLPDGLFPTMQAIMDKGIKMAVASGRPIFNLRELFQPMTNDLIIISDNGGKAEFHGEPVYSESLSKKELETFWQYFEEHNHIGVLIGENEAYLSKNNSNAKEDIEYFMSAVTLIDNLDEIDSPITKISIYFPDKTSLQAYNDFYKKDFEKNYSVTIGGIDWVDVMPMSVSKGRAILHLQDEFNIDKSETLVVADNYNDLSMMAEADFSFAVASANDDIRAAAKYIGPSNNDGAVVKIMQAVLKAYDLKTDKDSAKQ